MIELETGTMCGTLKSELIEGSFIFALVASIGIDHAKGQSKPHAANNIEEIECESNKVGELKICTL